jgi:Tol biopolymer transport system component
MMSKLLALVLILLTLGTDKPAQSNGIPSNGQIVFVSDRDGNDEIYVMDSHGSDVRRLTFNTESDWYPDWSPDGNRIAFASFQTGSFDIFVMNKDGSELVNLTPDPHAADFHPSWSPDGTQIAFSRTLTMGSNLYVMNADGTDLVKLVDGNGVIDNIFPTWSPDGQFIRFVATQSWRSPREYGAFWLTEIDLATGNQRQIRGMDSAGSPDWSWVNNTILYYGPEGVGGTVIKIMGPDGTYLNSLTVPPAEGQGYRYDSDQAWSPDGTHFVFHSEYLSRTRDRSGVDYDIFVANADGTGLVNLTPNNTADDMYPDWQPIPPLR